MDKNTKDNLKIIGYILIIILVIAGMFLYITQQTSDKNQTITFDNWKFEIGEDYSGGESASRANAILNYGNSQLMVYGGNQAEEQSKLFGQQPNATIGNKTIDGINYEYESYEGPSFNVQIINYKFIKDGTEFYIHTKIPLDDYNSKSYMEFHNNTIETIIKTIQTQ